MTEGYDGDAKLSTLFPVECPVCPDEEKTHMVDGPTRFTGFCEDHVLPIRGSAWIGYLAQEKLIGISKLTRIAHLYSKRLTSQERICHEIANKLAKDVQPRGVIVYIAAEHSICRREACGSSALVQGRSPHVARTTRAHSSPRSFGS